MAEEDQRALEETTRVAKDALTSLGRNAAKAGDSLAKLIFSEAQAANISATNRKKLEDLNNRERTARTQQEREQIKRERQSVLENIRQETGSWIGTLGTTAERMAAISMRFSQGTDPFMDALDAMSSAFDIGAAAVTDLGGSSKGGDAALKFGTVLIEQYRGIVQSFRDVSRSGIVLGGGLFELASIASEAGFGNVKQFAMALDAVRPQLENMGLAGGSAARVIGSTFRDLRENGGELGMQLTGLGYSMNEQVELIGTAMAQNRAAGVSNANLTKDTIELGKNMRLLSDLTGKDAKRLTEEARQAALRGRVVASLDGVQLKAYEAAMKGSNKVFSDALTEVVSPFGDIVTPELSFIASSVTGFREGLDEMKALVQSGADASTITAKRIEIEGKIQKATTDFFRENPFLAASGMLQNTTGPLKGITERLDTMNAAIVAPADQIAESQRRIAENMALMDPLLKEYAKTSEAAIKAQNEITQVMSKPVQAVAGGIESLVSTLSSFATKINEITKNLPNITSYRELPGGPNTANPSVLEANRIIEEIRRQREKTSPAPTPRAAGGSILPNQTYLVGERGPELLMSKETGMIMNNADVRQISSDPSAMLETKTFQNDMRQLMREQILLLRNHLSVSQDLSNTMDSLESIQARIASAAT
jgi:hypothetical protein